MPQPYCKWTTKEIDYILAHRGHRKLRAIAKDLGRSVGSVRNVLVYYGYSNRKPNWQEGDCLLRRLHKHGMSDAEIAKLIGVSKGTVQRRRVTLGLPANPNNGCRAQRRYRRQMKNADADNLVDLRWRKQRVEALLSGGGP